MGILKNFLNEIEGECRNNSKSDIDYLAGKADMALMIKNLLENQFKDYIVELPCKPGDVVYTIDSFFWNDDKRCIGCEKFHEGSDVFRDDDSCSYRDINDKENPECLCISETNTTKEWILRNLDSFHNTTFLSKEKAEEKIELLKSQNN